ncbi:MAG: hypothetical protein ACRC3Z_10655 [Phocaeicola sp.]
MRTLKHKYRCGCNSNKLQRVTMLFITFCTTLIALAQSEGSCITSKLVEMGFENVRTIDTPEKRIFTIENDRYKIQSAGIVEAVRLIQQEGLEEGKECEIIVLCEDIPQLSIRNRGALVSSEGSLEEWKTSYDVNESWGFVKKIKPENKSAFKIDILLYPQLYFRNLIITQIYQALLEFSPTVEVSLRPGMKLTGQIIFPVYNDGYGGENKTIRPGYITLSQMFRLPQNIQGRATIGVFDQQTYGVDMNLFYPFKDERFSLEARIGYVGFGYWDGFKFKYNSEYTTYWSVGGNFYWPRYNTIFKLRGEQYLLKEKGVKFEMIRQFKYAGIGFYAVKAEGANSNGGFRVFAALPPYKQKRHKKIPRVSTSLGTGITYNAGNEQYYYKMPYSNASDNLMQQNNFNPYFIKSELIKH